MDPVNRFEHSIRYCEFLEAQELAFICQYDLIIEVIFADDKQRNLSSCWAGQMIHNPNVSALLKKDFDHIKEIEDMKAPRHWPDVRAVRERSLAWLICAALEWDMSLRGISVSWFDVRVRITEVIEHI